jgi:hypothetical protein
MKKGRLIIDFESDEKGECSWNIQQEGKTKLDGKNLATLFETILRELLSDEFLNMR